MQLVGNPKRRPRVNHALKLLSEQLINGFPFCLLCTHVQRMGSRPPAISPGGALMAETGYLCIGYSMTTGAGPGRSENKAPSSRHSSAEWPALGTPDTQATNFTLPAIRRPHAGLSTQRPHVKNQMPGPRARLQLAGAGTGIHRLGASSAAPHL